MTIDFNTASIDRMIDWIRQVRRQHLDVRLSVLLQLEKIAIDFNDEQRLVDLVCVDLIERRRLGHHATAEEYTTDYPVLQSESYLLDLIDAELCVANELGTPQTLDSYKVRFPDLIDQIYDLVVLHLPHPAKNRQENSDRFNDVCQQTPESGDPADFSLNGSHSGIPNGAMTIEAIPPFDLPEWFVPQRSIARVPGSQLIRGRDSKRGLAMALKILDLPPSLSRHQQDSLFDFCARAAHVRNRQWIPPSIAAIHDHQLAILRPWIFARPWDSQWSAAAERSAESLCDHLNRLSAVAFSVAAVHQHGAFHGGLHANNLLIDHEGSVQILDAASSRQGLKRWLRAHARADSDSASPELIDAQDFVQLVTSACIQWNTRWAKALASEFVAMLDQSGDDLLYTMGDRLKRHSDSIDVSIDSCSHRSSDFPGNDSPDNQRLSGRVKRLFALLAKRSR